MKILPQRDSQKGQALLIVLLAMAVMLTVVLSVASRSVTYITVTTYEEDALRAFSAAEAGVETALLNTAVGPIPTPVTPLDPSDTTVKYDAVVTDPGESDDRFLYPDRLTSGDVATFWLVSHDDTGNLSCVVSEDCYGGNNINICLGDPNNIDPDPLKRPAIEAMLFYDISELTAKTDTFNGNTTNTTNNYQNLEVLRVAQKDLSNTSAVGFVNAQPAGLCGDPSNPVDGETFSHRTNIPLPAGCSNNYACPIMIKVRLYFSDNFYEQPVGIIVSGGGPASRLPAQGFQISSTGTAGGSERKVNVTQNYPESPTLFDSAVFSERDLVHQ